MNFPTLPSWTYDNAEFLELEKEKIFRRSWLIAGHASEIPNAGDYLTFDAADERALVIRGTDGVVRAFHNNCRHRASRVVLGESGHCKKAMVCPYHGWTYGFDGSLRAIPSEKTFSNIDKSMFSLPMVDLEEWHGFLFVRFEGGAGSVAEMMAPYEKEVGPYRFADMKPIGARSSMTLDVNWKCVVENDSEGYHVDIGHPGLRRLFGNSYYDQPFENGVARSWSVLRDELSSVWSERLYQKLLPSVDHLPESHRRAWWYLGLFPTPSFVIMPDHVQYYQVIPMGLHKTRIHGIGLGLEDGRREMRAARYLSDRINVQVAREDLGFCAWTDEGLRSRSYVGGPLSEREVALRSFVDQIREILPVARMSEPPADGRLTEVEKEFQAFA